MRPRPQSPPSLTPSPARMPPAGHLWRARLQGREDEGFTLLESLVTMVILTIVVALVLGFITNLVQQSTNVRDTMFAVRQDQIAGAGLLQYLHAATSIQTGSNATTLNASIYAGVDSSGDPQPATFTATLTKSVSSKVDAIFSTSLTPNTGPRAGKTSTVSDYDAVNSSTVFTYYYNDYSVTPVVLASTSTPTQAQLTEIVAVGINVTFLAGPQTPTEGFAAVRPTNFETTVYLQNASGQPAPATAVVVGQPTTTPVVGSPMTVTATVSPVPDGGTVTFAVSFGGSALSVCLSAVAVNTTDGTAPCTFTPGASGTYNVTATFSGTANFQGSTSPVTAIVVSSGTTTTISVSATRSGGQDTVTITATVLPSAATGTVAFTLQVCIFTFFCTTYNGSATLSGGTATWSQGSLFSGSTYSASAIYQGNSSYSASDSATSTGTLP